MHKFLNVTRLLAATINNGNNSVDIDIPEVTGSNLLSNGLNAVYFIAGIVAVGMIVYSGIQYLTSNGEPGKTKKAMNTIIYSVVGLVVIILAFAITNFVITNVS